MTRRAEFNAEEWATVVAAPLYAGMRVISAARGGTVRESLAMGRVYQQARERHGESELLDELVASPPVIDGELASRTADEIVAATAQHLRDAMAIVEAKATPAEVDDYKRFVMLVAQAAAEAHKEGGFLGIGGQRVSDAENVALDEISTALGSPPAS